MVQRLKRAHLYCRSVLQQSRGRRGTRDVLRAPEETRGDFLREQILTAMNWRNYREAEGLTDELIRLGAAVALLLVIISYLLWPKENLKR